LSDVYAMGGRPLTALAVVCFPQDADLAILEQIMSGGLSKMIEAGCTVVGGHSVRDAEMKFGYSITRLIAALLSSTAQAGPGDPARFCPGADASAPSRPTVSSQVQRRFYLPCGDCRHRARSVARRVIMRDHVKRRQESRREGKKKRRSRSTRWIICWLWMISAASGALRFRNENGAFQRAEEEGRRTAPPLIELGHLLSASARCRG